MWYIHKLDEPEEIVEWKRKFKKGFTGNLVMMILTRKAF